MRWSIRNQLLLPLLLLLVGVAAFSVWMILSAARQARQQIETRVRNVARSLSEESSYPLARNVLLQMKHLSGADYLLVPPRGEPVTTLPSIPRPLPPLDVVSADWQKLSLGPPLDVDGTRYLISGIRLMRPPRSGEILYILFPEPVLRDALWEAARPLVLLGGTVGLASLLLTVGVGRRLGHRFGQLERRTRLIAAGDFSPMPLPQTRDEIRDLAGTVNEMAAQLARLHETTRRSERLRLLGQVSGGLAHQLRNGVTGARLAVQVFLQEHPELDDPSPLEMALRQLALLETHLQRFLQLGGQTGAPQVVCSLADLLRDAVELLEPRCRHAGIALRWRPPADGTLALCGDPGQLGQLLVNVLSNAIEAAGPGGWVEVRAARQERQQEGWARIEVGDSGPGPPPELAERLFEPFVTGKPEGVGLGLAVAAQTAESHGGTLGWYRGDGATWFVLELPLRTGPAAAGCNTEGNKELEADPHYR